MEPTNVSPGTGNSAMDFIKKLNVTPLLLLKVVGVIVVAATLITILMQMLGSPMARVPSAGGVMGFAPQGFGGGMAYDTASSGSYDGSYSEEMSLAAPMAPTFSARNAASSMPYPQPGGVPGNDAEAYEVTQYSASIETRRLEDTCASVAALKARPEVIFEHANTTDRNCSFTFKVEHASVESVLAIVKGLDPKDFSENTSTIKRQISDYTSETEVLENKRASIDETLQSAINAYNEVTVLATRSQNADALAKIIDSKIRLIERLTQERININVQLDRLTRAKAEQLDRLEYTYFQVNVYESKFVDWKNIGDSWKASVKQFVYNFNMLVQNLTLNLILLLLVIVQWILYAVIALFVAKYGWKFAKDTWNR